ncbi:MAG: 50S ribosomal protein L25/general stress protein Ctc [Burkholderiaceae bacterium]|jgi:large subunit ribosomal protein L25|nr:50S ribosomal protein L25/general stress protein Ctc [Burkholderiaceae bacterium]
MKFVAFERAKQGTGASRRLRITGRTPGIVYGGESEPQLIEIDHNSLWHALKKEAFHASVLDMDLNGKEAKVLLRNVQFHPFKQLVLHVDFQRVDAKTKLHMKVPLHFKGVEESPAVKVDKCQVTTLLNELDVSCLPSDLPEFIEVDLSGLTKGAPLHVSDVKLPKGVSVVVRGGKSNPALLSIAAPAVEEAAPAEGAAPADEKKKPAGKK